MILLWVTLLLLHRGYTLVPVVKVQQGEPVRMTCCFPEVQHRKTKVYWYKQDAGDSLTSIVMLNQNTNLAYGQKFPPSRVKAESNETCTSLTILSTIQEDEGMYHCAAIDWTTAFWSATYLSLKGNSEKTSTYTVVQRPKIFDPVHQEDTLQCSVISEHENKACSEDVHLFWFRATSHKSLPDIIYAEGNGHNKCNKISQTQDRCVYNFSKSISSSDDGTYYCAVATCGEILFGNRTTADAQEQTSSFQFPVLMMTIIFLVISVTGNIVLICYKTPRAARGRFNRMENTSSQRCDNLTQPGETEDGHDLNYAAINVGQARGKKKRESRTEESVYSQVKYR
ncbi:uncharacterized protein LOC121643060 [Melanotaenia boesemani]|uniref:uncharacterized protein LOC121643060 n=1 Tax=Melanotaenia boesemani TaxID=1250792 RepID=UPI001C040A96|nr:uncharacterized protein LOC121643060 [Melanotaenia boesemani]